MKNKSYIEKFHFVENWCWATEELIVNFWKLFLSLKIQREKNIWVAWTRKINDRIAYKHFNKKM